MDTEPIEENDHSMNIEDRDIRYNENFPTILIIPNPHQNDKDTLYPLWRAIEGHPFRWRCVLPNNTLLRMDILMRIAPPIQTAPLRAASPICA